MSGPVVTLVVAAAENGVIGREGGMPWHMSTDLKHFRACTTGRPMIMGRRTFAAIGRKLPDRETVVVTRDEAFAAEGVHVAHGIEAALCLAADLAARMGAEEIAVVGGAEIYALALPYAGRIEMTEVHAAPEGDTHFPPPGSGWRETARRSVAPGPRDSAAMSFVTLERDAVPRALPHSPWR